MKSHLFYTLGTAILTICYTDGLKLQDGNAQFNEFLNQTMKEYRAWLQNNDLDPSPPTNTTITMYQLFGSVRLICELSRQIISGHSKFENIVTTAGSSFSDPYHAFMTQEISEAYIFRGEFNCSGELQKFAFPDLDENLPFTGFGQFVASINSTVEDIGIDNLGLTSDYKFDFAHSWPWYFSMSEINSVELIGDWNDTRISGNLLIGVQNGFHVLFKTFADNPNFLENYLYNPSALFLLQYIRETLENVVLTDIIGDDEEKPPVHIPTPSTTTTTTTTTTAIPTTSETEATTDSSSTTPPSTPTPPPSSGSRLLLNCSN